MQTISKLIEDGKKLLDEQNIENSLYDARRLMMEVYEKDLGFILCNPNFIYYKIIFIKIIKKKKCFFSHLLIIQ